MSMLEDFFHWRISSVVVPLLLAIGFGTAIDSDFIIAYLFFVLSGIWMLLSFLRSESMWSLANRIEKARTRGHDRMYANLRQNYLHRQSFGFAVIIGVAIAGCGFTYWKQQSIQLNSSEGLLEPANDKTPETLCSSIKSQGSNFQLLLGHL